MEEAFYFDNEGLRLFAVLHTPASSAARPPGHGQAGLVVCAPFGDEQIASYRTLRHLAGSLATRGIAVLRFDYRGYGDSEGEFSQALPETQIRDIERAIEVLRTRTGVSRVGLLALRLGAPLALAVAARRSDVRCLALWAPVLSTDEYFQHLLRKQALSEMMYGGALTTVAALRAELEAKGCVDIGGYALTAATVDAFRGLDAWRLLRGLRVPTWAALVDREETEGSRRTLARLGECGVRGEWVAAEPFWRFPDEGSTPPIPQALIEASAAWILGELVDPEAGLWKS